MPDAANDVYASLQIYLALQRVAEDQGITLRDSDYVIPRPSSPQSSPTRSSLTPGDANVRPSQLLAVDRFREGLTCTQIAEEKGVKVRTVM
jgi:hypothetical protein